MNNENHYQECWRAHHECAIAEIERLREIIKQTAAAWAAWRMIPEWCGTKEWEALHGAMDVVDKEIDRLRKKKT